LVAKTSNIYMNAKVIDVLTYLQEHSVRFYTGHAYLSALIPFVRFYRGGFTGENNTNGIWV